MAVVGCRAGMNGNINDPMARRIGRRRAIRIVSGCLGAAAAISAGAWWWFDQETPTTPRQSRQRCLPGKLYGATVYAATFGQTFAQTENCVWADPLFPQFLDAEIRRARSGGLNTLRATDWLLNHPPGPVNPRVFSNLQYLVDTASRNGLLVVIDLSAIRNHLEKTVGAGAGYDLRNWKDVLPKVIAQFESANNLAYWSLGGEPTPPKEGGVPSDQLTRYYDRLSRWVRALDPSHLISCGGLSHIDYDSGINWPSIFQLPAIDLAAIHVYSDGDERVTLPEVADWCHRNRKPWILEEFGFTQSLGDAARAAAFTRICREAWARDALGVLFWNLGPERKPASYDVGPDTHTPRDWQSVIDDRPPSSGPVCLPAPSL